jgi:AraC family transcriptional regulator of adaptative response/methylated-DNA-[protein]-cysteine methyltransferase
MKKLSKSNDINALQPHPGFGKAFDKIMKTEFSSAASANPLKAGWFNTPIGSMLAIGDNDVLYALHFVNPQNIEQVITVQRENFKAPIIAGKTSIIENITEEIQLYFAGKLTEFHTPIFHIGTPFQKKVWQAANNIPYAETRSYLDIATIVGRPTAYRAAAQALGACQFAVIQGCHRVINASGGLGGYGSSLCHKQYLINLEQSYLK